MMRRLAAAVWFIASDLRRESFTSSRFFLAKSRNLSANSMPLTAAFPDAGDGSECAYIPRDEADVRCIPVKAFFLSTSINLKSMHMENSDCIIPPTSRSLNYVALRFCDVRQLISHSKIELSWRCCRYMVVFQYGSAVLFNIADHEVEIYLDKIRKHALGFLPEIKKDEYTVFEKPLLETWMRGGPDHIIVRDLDTDGVRIVGNVLGQSIALDYYIEQVDGMIREFTDINRRMEQTGTFTMEKKKLFQLVGKANSSLADVILKLGLFEQSEIAWRNANYAQILEYLRDEYELGQRFGSLNFKLKFVEHNIHFFLEALQHRKSGRLTWGMIVLLALDNMIFACEVIHQSPPI